MNKSAAFVVVVVIAFFAIAIAPHVTSSDNSDNNVYGIIGAMPEETATLLDAMHETKCVKIGDREFHIGTLEGKKVIITECGPGVYKATHKDRVSCGKCGYTEFKKE